MSHAQEQTSAHVPFDFDKAIRATGEMRATVQRNAGLPSQPTTTTTNEVYLSRGADFLQVIARMSLNSLIPRFVIAFELKGRNPPSGTYILPTDDVRLLMCIVEGSDFEYHYPANSGRIEFQNHQPSDRVSGNLSFGTIERDGVSFTVVEANFDIKGTK